MSERPRGAEEFLSKKYDLESSKEAEKAVERQERISGMKVEKTPKARIRAYLDRLIAVLEPAERDDGHIDRKERNLSIIKRFLHEDLLVEAEPAVDAFLVHQRKMARERGMGTLPEVPADMRERLIESVDDVAFGDDTIQEATEGMEASERQVVEEVVAKREAQRTSLDAWVNYLTLKDAKVYPDWFKYWAFRSVMGMSEYDKEKKSFPSRDETSVNPFPTLDQQALGKVLENVTRYEEYRANVDAVKAEVAAAKRARVTRDQERLINRRMGELRRGNPDGKIDRAAVMRELGIELPEDSELPRMPEVPEGIADEERQAFDGRDFAELYAREFSRLEVMDKGLLQKTDGEWRKYPQGSDAQPLVDSIERHKTGWCTAGIDVARSQLSRGDFWVYYSEDKNGDYTVPRAAIRMEAGAIDEVRGIAPDQNADPYITKVISEKMTEFPDGTAYEKKAADMDRVSAIDARVKTGGELSEADLRFLYEIDGKIEGFGYDKDPRVTELLSGRDVRADLSLVLSCAPEQISLSKKEALSGGIRYHYGDLDLNGLTSAEGLTLPESVSGSLHLSGLTSAEGLTLPESVGDDLYLSSLTSAKDLTLPESMGGDLYLSGLTSAEGLTLPESVGGTLSLSGLTSAKDLTLPESVGGSLYLNSLTSAEGLTLPESVGGDLDLNSLTSAEGLTLPESMGGDLYLSGLTSAEGLTLPESVGGSLYLFSLTSAEGLTLPESMSGNLDLSGLTSTKDLALPESVGGYLYLSSLTSAKDLTLPESVGGSLYLFSLTSAEGLTLPESVGGGFYLNSLTSAEGLTLPESMGGGLYLNSLTSAEKDDLRRKYPHLNIQ